MSQIDTRQSLADLAAVRVVVEEPLPPGLSRETIKAGVEARLRAAGVRVQGAGDFPTGDPHLRISLSPPAQRDGLVALFVQVDFAQIVFLRRNPQVTFNRAQTWKTDGGIVLVPAPGIAGAVSSELDRQVDRFVAAYRELNP